MNIYEAMRRVLEYAIGYLDIVPNAAYDNPDIIAIDRMIAEYDALAPDWSRAPEWAQWYAVDKIGATFFATEPYADEEECCWFFSNDGNQPEPIEIDVVILPDHIDWRDCKWHRPEVTK